MHELPKSYEANTCEEKWYRFWEENGFFQANPKSKKPAYCIVIPPPNVTGVLHMGHALDNTLQDILIRWKRMKGYEVLWQPGTDHAGIATQTVVERRLLKDEGKRRIDYPKHEFLAHVWAQKEKSEAFIISQLKRIGCSLDWSRTRFTMDEGCSRAVRVMFKRLFDQGLIVRGDYLVNWDPVTRTALADDEVEYEDKSGFIYYFKYPLADESGFITFATTRPETMLGDVAIAVNPKDERYSALHHKMAVQPLTGRHLLIVGDDHVDPSFGTGCVKITPAHDFNDYEIGLRHNLEMISIMNDDGTINEKGAEFAGMTMEKARAAIIEKMKALGFFIKQEAHLNRIGVSYRSKAVIEPHLSKQWFVKLSNFKDALRKIVQNKKTRIYPERWETTYFHWIDNLRDWCISRQLWWGHQIPIWYKKDDHSQMICFDGEGVPEEVKNNPDQWEQDPDVLDTWFSSALWPFATLGWPDNTDELKKFYPNSTLITGHDILFFWVARMLMMGSYALDEPPFPETFLHGLIYSKSYYRAQQGGGIIYANDQERKEYDLGKPCPKDVTSRWEKMSKTKGNVIDPIEVIDEYGADAIRLALAFSTTDAPQIDLDRRRFEEFKNFANKVWNGARFVLMNLSLTSDELTSGIDHGLLTLEDHWILQELREAILHVETALQSYAFDKAAREAYEFFWNRFCAYYVEMVKPVLFGKQGDKALQQNKQKILVVVLLQALRLLHPMAPFITEELFSYLKSHFKDLKAASCNEPFCQEAIEALFAPACMMAPFPKPLVNEQPAVKDAFAIIESVIYAIRNIRGEMKVTPQTATDLVIVGSENENASNHISLLRQNERLITALVKTASVTYQKTAPQEKASSTSLHEMTLFIPLPKEMLEQEKERLKKEEAKILALLEKGQLQIQNPQFVEKAPPQLIEKHKAQIAAWENELARIRNQL